MHRLLISFCLGGVLLAAENGGKAFRLDSLDGLKSTTKLETVEYRGRKAVHLLAPGDEGGDVLVLPAGAFRDGTLEIEVAGKPAPGADAGARGFIGLSFRVQPDGKRYECFYLRPTNGRVEDQLRRNHATQYTSEPDYPWYRLRKENPGVYESYVDIESGVWTKMKIVVSGKKAQLFVNGAQQPCLIVNELKGNGLEGGIALWVGQGTDGYFSNLVVK
jgi:hypothetical protein